MPIDINVAEVAEDTVALELAQSVGGRRPLHAGTGKLIDGEEAVALD